MFSLTKVTVFAQIVMSGECPISMKNMKIFSNLSTLAININQMYIKYIEKLAYDCISGINWFQT